LEPGIVASFKFSVEFHVSLDTSRQTSGSVIGGLGEKSRPLQTESFFDELLGFGGFGPSFLARNLGLARLFLKVTRAAKALQTGSLPQLFDS